MKLLVPTALLAVCLGSASLAAPLSSSNQTNEDSTAASTPTPEKEKAAKEKLQKPVLNEGLEKIRLNEIVVSATRSERNAKDVPGSVSVKSANQISQSMASNIRGLVQDELDVTTQKNSGGSGSGGRSSIGLQGYNIRGIDGNRILIQTDGIRQPEQYTFGGIYSIGRNYQDVASLDRVEILKGSASSLYGSDAIGGVVTYVTKDPSNYLQDKNYYSDLQSSFDSSNKEFSESTTSALRSGPVDLLFSYSRHDGEETSAKGSYDSNPLLFHGNNYLGKIAWKPNNLNKVTATGEYYTMDSDASLANQLGTFDLSSFGPRVVRSSIDQDFQTRRFRMSLDHEFKDQGATPIFDSFAWKVYGQPSQNNEQTTELYTRQSTSPAPGAIIPYKRYFDRDYTNDLIGGNLQFTKEADTWDWDHLFTYGMETSVTHIERNVNGYIQNLNTGVVSTSFGSAPSASGPYFMPYKEIPDTDILRLGFYGQDEITFDQEKTVSVIPGIRVDYYDLSIKNSPDYTKVTGLPGTAFKEWSGTPKIGAIGKINQELSAYGQFAMGFRSPTAEDLNGVFKNSSEVYKVIPNQNLKSETSYNFEAGLRGDYAPVKFDVAGYYNYYTDFINQQTKIGVDPADSLNIYQSVNLKEAEIYGTTAKVELPLGYWNPTLEGLSVILGTALSWGNDLEHNRPLDSIEPFKFTQTLRYKQEKWGIDLINTVVDQKYSIPYTSGAANFAPPAYDVIDLVAYYQPTKNLKINLGIYNLADQKYWLWQDVRSVDSNGNLPVGSLAGSPSQIDRYTQPGTSVRASVTLIF